jgi:hypothetical protein
LTGVNIRFDSILNDLSCTSRLTLFKCSNDGIIYPLYNNVINQFCFRILPKIHIHIKWLNIELSSMERILLATSYPNLSGLGLYNLNVNLAECLFHSKKCDLVLY